MPRDTTDPADDDTGPIRRVPSAADGAGDGGPRRRASPADRHGTARRVRQRQDERPQTPQPARPQRTRRAQRTERQAPARKHTPAAPPAPIDTGHSHGHGHGHGHGPAQPVSRRVRNLLIALLVPVALATVLGVGLLYPWGAPEPESAVTSGVPVSGEVTATASSGCLEPGQVQVGEPDPAQADQCVTVDIRLTEGATAGQVIRKVMPIEPSTPTFAVGDEVVLSFFGEDPADPGAYQIRDFQRGLPLGLLAALFAAAVIALGRWRGLAALVALGLSFLVIVLFILPAVLAGGNPLLVAIAGSSLIMFVALYLTHGLSARTSVAVLGTMISLALIGVISALFSAAAKLTGLDEDTSVLIASLGHGIDARGLLLAGVVIGALGVLDDVTVTQTSAVWELRRANPALTVRELYGAGLRIGRDHVGSAVNTLVMAYAGAALPVLLVASLSGVGLGPILGAQDIAQEIVRTLAGSIGIIAAVPVTTMLAALIATREKLPAAPPTPTASTGGG